jgi:hypothetical protein
LARRGWDLLVGERPRRVSAALGLLAIDFEILGLCRHWSEMGIVANSIPIPAGMAGMPCTGP